MGLSRTTKLVFYQRLGGRNRQVDPSAQIQRSYCYAPTCCLSAPRLVALEDIASQPLRLWRLLLLLICLRYSLPQCFTARRS